MPSISVVIITYKRHVEVLDAIASIAGDPNYDEIVVIDNDPLSDLVHKLPKDTTIKYFLQKENSGVAGGRNAGINCATGDILVFLDDDAIFFSDKVLAITRKYFERDAKLACLAYRIENYYSRKIVPMEFPHPDTRKADAEMYGSYFLGGACALRRSALEKVGLFMDLQYGGEELELSFRLIKAGYRLLYTPKVLVLHKASGGGRFDSGRYIYLSVRNRMKLLSRHLPLRHLLVNISLWNVVWFLRAAKSRALQSYFMGLKAGLREMAANIRDEHRQVLNEEAINYIKRHGGRLWF